MPSEDTDFVTRPEFHQFAKSIREAIGDLAEEIKSQRTAIGKLSTAQATTGTLSGGTLLGIAGFVVASIGLMASIITVIGAMALNPVRTSLSDHLSATGHPPLQTAIAEIKEKFTEVETQFDGERNLRMASLDALDQKLQKDIEASRDLIDKLWERVYNGPNTFSSSIR